MPTTNPSWEVRGSLVITHITTQLGVPGEHTWACVLFYLDALGRRQLGSPDSQDSYGTLQLVSRTDYIKETILVLVA